MFKIGLSHQDLHNLFLLFITLNRFFSDQYNFPTKHRPKLYFHLTFLDLSRSHKSLLDINHFYLNNHFVQIFFKYGLSYKVFNFFFIIQNFILLKLNFYNSYNFSMVYIMVQDIKNSHQIYLSREHKINFKLQNEILVILAQLKNLLIIWIESFFP